MFDRGTCSCITNRKTTALYWTKRNHSEAFHYRMAIDSARTEKSRLKNLFSVPFKPVSLVIPIGDGYHELFLFGSPPVVAIKHLQQAQKLLVLSVSRWTMVALVGASEPPIQLQAFLGARMQVKGEAGKKYLAKTMIQNELRDSFSALIPGLPEDLAKICIALVPRSYFPAMGAVSKGWMTFITSQELIAVRKEVGKLEEWIYVLTAEAEGKRSRWEVLGSLDQKKRILPPMPGLTKAGFGVVVLGGKLFIMAGYAVGHGKEFVSDEVYRYDACLNRWTILAKMNIARRDFACAELNGMIYVAGGFGPAGESLCSVEAYSPQQNKWTLIESLRRPRWGCFACAFNSQLYIMGGRSSFTIGNSRYIDVYDPHRHAWEEIKKGCVMVTSHAVVDKRLFCIEWKNPRTIVVFNPDDNSWQRIPVPLTGSSRTRFCLGVLGGKVLLFSMEEEPGYQTLMYDPAAPGGSEWLTSELKPSGLCICTVTIEV